MSSKKKTGFRFAPKFAIIVPNALQHFWCFPPCFLVAKALDYNKPKQERWFYYLLAIRFSFSNYKVVCRGGGETQALINFWNQNSFLKWYLAHTRLQKRWVTLDKIVLWKMLALVSYFFSIVAVLCFRSLPGICFPPLSSLSKSVINWTIEGNKQLTNQSKKIKWLRYELQITILNAVRILIILQLSEVDWKGCWEVLILVEIWLQVFFFLPFFPSLPGQ